MGRVARTPSPRLPAARRFRLVTAVLAVVALTGTTAASCGDDAPAVTVAEVGRAPVSEVIDAPATVTARAAATLTAPADGTLARLRVQPGQRVTRGQVLAVIDSPSARDRLAKARDALRAAERAGRGTGTGDLGGSRRGTDRAADEAFAAARAAAGKVGDPRVRAALLLQVSSAQRQYESAARAADRAVAQVQRGVAGLNSAVGALSAAQRLQAQQAYDLAKATVDALTLRAPIAGVVQPGGTRSPAPADLAGLLGAAGGAGVPGLDPSALGGGGQGGPPPGVDDAIPAGGRVTAGTPVLTVVDVGRLGLLAEVDETDVLLVRAGVPASVELDAVTGATYDATVRSVDVLPTSSARGGVTYRVRLDLGAGRLGEAEAAPAPRPGMNAVVRLRVREAADAVAVPASAVFSTDGRDAVWVLRDGRADRVPVTVGVQGQDLVQIVDGVRAGDRVVVRGADQVRDGQELR
ncbi:MULTISPECIES: efflux RND transporter periplasmic adaptor subunit [unclassified Micromonospora]|uniref:efflux RND transporter periplasmic adaptor subunit n=1 Tax=unclassified Micromonospora TaxID=2617518 RepID=UPI00188F4323|nr:MULTISPECIES: efflux RND transporter periplasmic adaptor subunit [unclassified Micromonospora]MBF5031714.1 efflux RND transporter periplasmic adaptor subunit [Micromonospora sp. ANENR4]MCZ7477801.1 efflux RND transporter periplasmic adaptor subunit [Micromonospora sp. WMMC273]WBC02523.1 efflux RND transporter periplasmic adaptor subunit [Micromonospora sp. WMMA1976]